MFYNLTFPITTDVSLFLIPKRQKATLCNPIRPSNYLKSFDQRKNCPKLPLSQDTILHLQHSPTGPKTINSTLESGSKSPKRRKYCFSLIVDGTLHIFSFFSLHNLPISAISAIHFPAPGSWQHVTHRSLR